MLSFCGWVNPVLTTSSGYDDESIAGTVLNGTGNKEAQVDGYEEEEVRDEDLVVLHIG